MQVNLWNIIVIWFACISFFQCSKTMNPSEEKNIEMNEQPQEMNHENETRGVVYADVILLSKTGQNPLGVAITSENINDYLPNEERVKELTDFFKEQNLTLEYVQGISASLSGFEEDFENLFGIELIKEGEQFFVNNQEEETAIPLDKLSAEVAKEIVAISLPPKVEFFD